MSRIINEICLESLITYLVLISPSLQVSDLYSRENWNEGHKRYEFPRPFIIRILDYHNYIVILHGVFCTNMYVYFKRKIKCSRKIVSRKIIAIPHLENGCVFHNSIFVNYER